MTEAIINNEETILPFEKSIAFIIGINNYLRLDKLTTAVNDAKKLGEVLETAQRFEVHYLLDATKNEIEELLENTIGEKAGEEDRLLFYFAGHGIATQSDDLPEGYIMPADAVKKDVNTYINMKDIRDAIDGLPCLHVLLILNCCFSGAFKWSSRFRDGDILIPKRIHKEHLDRFVDESARQVITSTSWNQRSIDTFQKKTLVNVMMKV